MRKTTIETLTITRVVQEDGFPTSRDVYETASEPVSERRMRTAVALPEPFARLEAWTRRALP